MATTENPVLVSVHKFLARFPLYTYPAWPLSTTAPPSGLPTLWIHPSTKGQEPLSSDVECLKWQAWLALRGVAVSLRSDVHPDGGVDGKLPTLHLPDNTVHPAHAIPSALSIASLPHEGYASAEAELESKAFLALLESTLHKALFPDENPPRGPITGILPPEWLASVKPVSFVEAREAITALSGRLGSTDVWFLGSERPTALDAAAFAYLHTALTLKVGHPAEVIKREVERRPNLLRFHQNVEEEVRNAFQ
ncbi:hypothetical protein DACRYDRAFT_113704 [Dacryopinax primogenitus]|uniref:Metaxin glutathione S-transferase domain-containing protein n=1 Tax=Dacryopinax primogenitus (strain DJM 731) TaxID=1858805 RepID=M5G5V6_DACPD|nr:uncharacterized protein DACRYDRAFT_113704 [Dacryopinax primogenitus]EJU05641.1 hypothetical protein DACRYDRAFT_113704 [Dacryopinax primogenitus]